MTQRIATDEQTPKTTDPPRQASLEQAYRSAHKKARLMGHPCFSFMRHELIK
ncbi:MAG: hypothetical protein Q4B88_05555 [Moraxella sp.]|nr:hypothetical protein [Moraxella sp.]